MQFLNEVVFVSMFYGDEDYEIDRFKVHMKHGFQEKRDFVRGLNGMAVLVVKYSPSVYDFGYYLI